MKRFSQTAFVKRWLIPLICLLTVAVGLTVFTSADTVPPGGELSITHGGNLGYQAGTQISYPFQVSKRSGTVGLSEITLTVTYDSTALTLRQAARYAASSFASCVPAISEGTATIALSSASNPTAVYNGILVNLFFDVKSGATPGLYDVVVTGTGKDASGGNVTISSGTMTLAVGFNDGNYSFIVNADDPDTVTLVGVVDQNAAVSTGDVTLPATAQLGQTVYDVTVIESALLMNATSVTVPEGVKRVSRSAFVKDFNGTVISAMRSLNLPATLERIGDTADRLANGVNRGLHLGQNPGDSLLEEITVAEGNQYFRAVDGVLFSADMETLIKYPPNRYGARYTVPDGVKMIESVAFNGATVYEVEFPRSIESLEYASFLYCVNVRDMIFHDSPVVFKDLSVMECSSLVSINIPAGSTVGRKAFELCENLRSVTFDGAVTFASAGGMCFNRCYALESVVIPEGATSLPYRCFADCSSLTSVTLPDSLLSIGNQAFQNCSALSEISIPGAVATLGTDVIKGCTALTSVVFEPAIGNRSITLPNGFFNELTSLESVTLPQGLTTIPNNCFGRLSNLKSVTVPASVTVVGGSAFETCDLRSITLPGVTSVGGNAFRNCSMLTEVNLPSAVLIGEYAFSGCRLLRSVTVSLSLCSIENGAFDTCFELERFVFSGGTAVDLNLGEFAFGHCIKLESVDFPSTLTRIGAYAFAGCSNLISLGDLSGVRTVGSYAFSDCESLKQAIFSDNLTSMGAFVFNMCSSLESVYLSQNLTAIPNNSFAHCGALQEIIIPDAVQTIGLEAFSWCENLARVRLPANLESIGNQAFGGCPITVLTLPNNLSSIGNGAFSSSRIQSVVFPPSLLSIGDSAFGECQHLSKIVFSEGLQTIGENAFRSCSMAELTLPQSLSSIGDSAFGWNYPLGSLVIKAQNITMGTSVFAGRTGDLYVRCPATGTVHDYMVDNGHTLVYDTAVNSDGILYSLDTVNLTASVVGVNDTSIGSADITLGASGSVTSGVLTLPPRVLHEGVTYNVTEINPYAFGDCVNLVTVNLPEGIAQIEAGAFSGCTSLSQLNLPDSLSFMYGTGIIKNTAITSINIPKNVSYIGEGAFAGCSSLESITVDPLNINYSVDSYGILWHMITRFDDAMQQNVTVRITLTCLPAAADLTSVNGAVTVGAGEPYRAGAYAFSGCTSLRAAVLNSCTYVGENCFENCTALESATVPCNSEANAFTGCEHGVELTLLDDGSATVPSFSHSPITSVYVPDCVTEISDSAFYGCNRLSEVTGMDSVTRIGHSAFYGCASLSLITLPTSLETVDSFAFGRCTTLVSLPLPAGLTTLGEGAFYYCASLNSIGSIPAGITAIGISTFCDTALSSIVIPDTVQSVGISAFARCRSLLSVTLSASLTSIAQNTFAGSGLLSVVIPQGVLSIEQNAFGDCTALSSVTLPSTLTRIGADAFSRSGLESVTIPASVDTFEVNINGYSRAFANCPYLETAVINANVTALPSDMFSNCISLENVTLPAGLTAIPNSMFARTRLSSIVIPAGVQTIGNYAFQDTRLSSVVIPDRVTSIGNYAFLRCTGLTSVTLSARLETVGTGAFRDCSITSLSLPASMRTLGALAFANNRRLLTVTAAEGLTAISDSAFQSCTKLTEFILPDSLLTVGNNAFYYCNSLSDIGSPANLSSIGAYAFYFTKVMTGAGNSYVIPDGVTTIGNNAFNIYITIKHDGVSFTGVIASNVFCYEGSAVDTLAHSVGQGVTYIRDNAGKISGGATVTNADVALAQSFAAGDSTAQIDQSLADVNGDSSVNVFDIIAIQQKAAGQDVILY